MYFPVIHLFEVQEYNFRQLYAKSTCRYNPTTGVFTVPPGSGGLYFFSTHLVIDDKKWARLGMKKNNEFLCGFYEDNQSSANEDGTGSCSATVKLNAGTSQ